MHQGGGNLDARREQEFGRKLKGMLGSERWRSLTMFWTHKFRVWLSKIHAGPRLETPGKSSVGKMRWEGSWAELIPLWESVLVHYENSIWRTCLLAGRLGQQRGWDREVLGTEEASWSGGTCLAGDLSALLRLSPWWGCRNAGFAAFRPWTDLTTLSPAGLWSDGSWQADRLAQGWFLGNSRQPAESQKGQRQEWLSQHRERNWSHMFNPRSSS